jgi:methanogenic corrinoid protein MtbC1
MCAEAAVLHEAGEALAPFVDEAVSFVLRRYDEIRPDLMRQFDAKALAAVESDVRHHLEFLVQALVNAEPAIMDDYVAWAATLFGGLGLPEEWLTESLEFVAQSGHALLTREQAETIDAVIRDAVVRMPARGFAPPPFVLAEGTAGPLAVSYLAAVLVGDRAGAIRMLSDAIEDGMPLETAYLHVIAPVQSDIGRLWLTSRITVAQEHVATAVTQSVLGALWPFRVGRERNGRSVVVACVGSELHEIGAHIVSDFFELSGWGSVYLGANTPLTAILAAVDERSPDVVALSATMAPHLTDLRMAVDAVRHTEGGNRAKIIVGGRPFNVAPGLWRAVGADGWAPEAAGAVRVAGAVCGD